MKLGGSTPPPAPAPTEQPQQDISSDNSSDDFDMDFNDNQDDSNSDGKPFGDEPFEAGVEADEDSDPKKFIQQLAGKLGQTLRTYTKDQGGPDFELEKFAVNSLLSATHTGEMDPNDQKDIISKVKKSGNDGDNGDDITNDSSDDISNDDNGGGSDGDNTGNEFGDDFGSGESDSNGEEVSEGKPKDVVDCGMFMNPKKNNMFQPNSNDVLNDKKLQESNKMRKFVIKTKLQETFNQEEMNAEPMITPSQPVVKPSIEPIKPSRKNKPFILPTTLPAVDPKAVNEAKNFDYETYHKTLSATLDEARNFVIKRGYDAVEFTMNDVQHVSYGHTERFHKELSQNGKPQRKTLNLQIYRMDSGTYELNMYIA